MKEEDNTSTEYSGFCLEIFRVLKGECMIKIKTQVDAESVEVVHSAHVNVVFAYLSSDF